jgi:uncharacterized membrane protein YccF (DUF307 family)
MRTILNIIWLVLCGFWMALGYVVAGVIPDRELRPLAVRPHRRRPA